MGCLKYIVIYPVCTGQTSIQGMYVYKDKDLSQEEQIIVRTEINPFTGQELERIVKNQSIPNICNYVHIDIF